MQEKLGLLDLGAVRGEGLHATRPRPSATSPATSCRARSGTQVHGGLDAVSGDPRYGDTSAPRPVAEYLREALEKNWFPMFPAPGERRRCSLSIFGNVLRHSRNNTRLRETLWPKVKLARRRQLPHERDRALRRHRPAGRVLVREDRPQVPRRRSSPTCTSATAPRRRSAKPSPSGRSSRCSREAVAREARRRDLAAVRDIADVERDARRARRGVHRPRPLRPRRRREGAGVHPRVLVASRKNVRSPTCASAGAVRFAGTGTPGRHGRLLQRLLARPSRSCRTSWFVEKKQRWPTLTGRQQFYVDHPWFLECGEALPTLQAAAQAPAATTRWCSAAATRAGASTRTWRDQRPMLRLQRGEPVVY